jgi:hypothetical protein
MVPLLLVSKPVHRDSTRSFEVAPGHSSVGRNREPGGQLSEDCLSGVAEDRGPAPSPAAWNRSFRLGFLARVVIPTCRRLNYQARGSSSRRSTLVLQKTL